MKHLLQQHGLVLLICVFATGGWYGQRERNTLSSPQAESVTSLLIADVPRKAIELRTIENPEIIRQFMAVLNEVSNRWEWPRSGLPMAKYQVTLAGDYGGVLSGQVTVLLGQDWLAAIETWEHSGATRMVSLSSDEMGRVQRLLGIEP